MEKPIKWPKTKLSELTCLYSVRPECWNKMNKNVEDSLNIYEAICSYLVLLQWWEQGFSTRSYVLTYVYYSVEYNIVVGASLKILLYRILTVQILKLDAENNKVMNFSGSFWIRVGFRK